MTSRTALLWFQYMDMVNILERFLKAERTGNWGLHLQTVHDMLPYFAASGHALYAKCAYVYLQTMLNLPKTHPDVYRKFQEGYHVVRRSDRFWAGLSSDLIIEQVLMRSVKTDGGLTGGKGMTENQRLVWVLSMPACASTNEAMQKLSGVSYETSDQHKDTSAARQARDVSDTLQLITYLTEKSPFAEKESLFNIANGMTAQEGVNVERSREVGEKILSSMKYGPAAIVFDGYSDDPTIKDATHLRRTADCAGVKVHFTGGMVLQSKKEEFLNNKVNKQRFICFVSDKLERAGCSVDHAKDDADVLIARQLLHPPEAGILL
ncbi:hypothetical protein BSL78_02744 [Apostichopus japonicus]|uniref:Uncharacterized protein n=1 Tax=Stichopus japonicus TaxID=307972 RepID=A0A2G8LJ73_STIJA|nr:hypothetical protein BSL78_02744 [Apostichopus japonicus]